MDQKRAHSGTAQIRSNTKKQSALKATITSFTALMVFFALAHVLKPAHAKDTMDPGRCKQGDPVHIIAFGDSLTAGLGLTKKAAFPYQLEKALKARGHNVMIANAGVSGETTSGGLARFNWTIVPQTDAVILELGANDALRGLSPEKAQKNLDEIIRRLKARKIAVLLTGMRALRNWGGDYENAFNPIFERLSAKHDTLLYPFFLEGVALDPKLNQSDGLHPNTQGVLHIVKRILPKAEELLARAKALCDVRESKVKSSN